jgi:mono/diheme cytochrome c family protein
MRRCKQQIVTAAFVAAAVTMAPSAATIAATADADLPAGPGRDIVYGHCRTCHSLTYLTDSAGISRDEWDAVVQSMHQLGMPKIGQGDRKTLVDYLGTYLGPNPRPQHSTASAGSGASHGEAESVDGKAIFRQQCASCHQRDGKGVRGQYPPLAENPDLFLSKDLPALVVLNGLNGKIEVEGRTYHGVMPSFDYLSDEKIAAVVQYVRTSFGNDSARPKDLSRISADDVAAARKQSLGASGVREQRAKLRQKNPPAKM